MSFLNPVAKVVGFINIYKSFFLSHFICLLPFLTLFGEQAFSFFNF